MGRDFSRWLPGLFWLNFFGPPYVDLIGKQRLLSAGADSRPLGSGVVLQVADDPAKWDSPAYRDRERSIQTAIGDEYFFSKNDPDRDGVALRWENVGA